MPEQTSVAANFAGALAHPVRLGIIAALAQRPRTLDSLARTLDVSKQRVSRHARALESMGLVRPTDDQPRTYELLREPVLWEQAWSELPLPARRETMAAILTQIHATAATAVDAGGFDRPDSYLTRTSVRMSEDQWCEVAEEFGDLLRRLETVEDDPTGTPATVITMLFSGEHTEAGPPGTSAPAFGEEEALERTWELAEAIDAEATDQVPVDWDRIAALADEVRLVARAAACLDDTPQPARAD